MGRSVSSPAGAYVTFAETPVDSPYCCTCGEHVDIDSVGAASCGCDLTEFRRWEDWATGCSEVEVEEVEDPREWIEGETDWDWLVDDFRSAAMSLWPSLWEDHDWKGREDHILATNSFAHFGVSEYCGLMAIWLVPRTDIEFRMEALAARWCAQQFPKLKKAFGTFNKIGAMSNGRGVFAPITGGPVLAEEIGGHVRI